MVYDKTVHKKPPASPEAYIPIVNLKIYQQGPLHPE